MRSERGREGVHGPQGRLRVQVAGFRGSESTWVGAVACRGPHAAVSCPAHLPIVHCRADGLSPGTPITHCRVSWPVFRHCPLSEASGGAEAGASQVQGYPWQFSETLYQNKMKGLRIHVTQWPSVLGVVGSTPNTANPTDGENQAQTLKAGLQGLIFSWALS